MNRLSIIMLNHWCHSERQRRISHAGQRDSERQRRMTSGCLRRRFPCVDDIYFTLQFTLEDKDLKINPIVVLKIAAHFARYVRGIFDNEESFR